MLRFCKYILFGFGFGNFTQEMDHMLKATFCKDCIFWSPPEGESDGECRIGRPSLAPPSRGIWPKTTGTEFCGEGAKAKKT